MFISCSFIGNYVKVLDKLFENEALLYFMAFLCIIYVEFVSGELWVLIV